MRACDTCKHEQKSAVDNPCRNCLPSPSLPAWESAAVEKTPAARIAELEAEVATLKALLGDLPPTRMDEVKIPWYLSGGIDPANCVVAYTPGGVGYGESGWHYYGTMKPIGITPEEIESGVIQYPGLTIRLLTNDEVRQILKDHPEIQYYEFVDEPKPPEAE
jgi:hypothetical protein